MKHKWKSKVDIWQELIDSAKQETVKKVKQHGIESEKAKKLVEGSVFISYIIQRLDEKHKAFFKLLYMHEQLYRVFIRQPVTFKSSYDFENLYQGCTILKQDSPEYLNAINKEMQKFNGKISVGEDATTASDVTS